MLIYSPLSCSRVYRDRVYFAHVDLLSQSICAGRRRRVYLQQAQPSMYDLVTAFLAATARMRAHYRPIFGLPYLAIITHYMHVSSRPLLMRSAVDELINSCCLLHALTVIKHAKCKLPGLPHTWHLPRSCENPSRAHLWYFGGPFWSGKGFV